MKRFLLMLLVGGLAVAQGPRTAAPKGAAQPGKSALDRATLEAYVRHLQLYLPNITLTVGDPKPSQLPGFVEVTVRASLGAASEERLFYISKDGQKVVQGSVYDVKTNPFKPELDKLKTDGSPSIGTPGAAVVVVVFSDFQCTFCKEEAKMLRENLVKTYPTQVRLYFKDYPLTQIHPWANLAAVAGRCLSRQSNDDFWTYHDWIFANQESITIDNVRDRIAEFAKSKSWDGQKLTACMASPEPAAEIERSTAEGRLLNVTSTPTLFINGRRIAGSIKWEQLKQVIDFEIGYQKTAQNAGEACCSVALPSLLPQHAPSSAPK
jgi:protein-disulfide isomerase